MVKVWRRFIAYIIDMIIVGFVVVNPFRKYLVIETFKDVTLNVLGVYVLIGLLTVLYFAIFEFYFSQTIGKFLVKISVRSKTKRLLFKQCFLRSISKISTILYILDLLYLMKGKQRYLEVRSKTITI